MKKIPIFFAFDNNYVEPAAVAFYSLLNKAKPDVFYEMYVIHSAIEETKQNLLHSIVKRFHNADLHFINSNGFGNDIWKNGSFSSGHSGSTFTVDTVVRCFAARFFPQYDKIIYSDVDIVVVDDISELYDIDLTEKYIAGVKNPFMKYSPTELSHLKTEHFAMLKDSYIGGGIWVMNLKKMREDNLEARMMEIINDKTIIKQWPDQDIINIACEGKIAFVPLNYISFPYLPELLKKDDFVSHYSREELYDSVINPKIIHYASGKPWNNNPEFSNVWWTIFHYLKLARTVIFTPPRAFIKKKKLKRNLILASSIAVAEFIILAIIFFTK